MGATQGISINSIKLGQKINLNAPYIETVGELKGGKRLVNMNILEYDKYYTTAVLDENNMVIVVPENLIGGFTDFKFGYIGFRRILDKSFDDRVEFLDFDFNSISWEMTWDESEKCRDEYIQIMIKIVKKHKGQ